MFLADDSRNTTLKAHTHAPVSHATVRQGYYHLRCSVFHPVCIKHALGTQKLTNVLQRIYKLITGGKHSVCDVLQGAVRKARFAGENSENKNSSPASPDTLAERICRRETNVLTSASMMGDSIRGRKDCVMAVREETAQDEKSQGGGELKPRCSFKNLLWQSALMRFPWRKRRKRDSPITESCTGKACLREEGLSTSNINKAFLDAAKDILNNN
ncbi:hypothetical protein PROFUN_15502 [Planoprotostelium fungivorum]|uniref:Uncharacterized protein n=1 Tax=Planoprotostelium fungivorum TaxID=1890364 RepID=A0A2P6MSR2_9EUKA|nr:hypothetical protein PROFUN_15502 [Planoprotostelium fungivorum]